MGKDITFFVSKISYFSKRIIDLNCTIVPFSKKVLSFSMKSSIDFDEKEPLFCWKVPYFYKIREFFLIIMIVRFM